MRPPPASGLCRNSRREGTSLPARGASAVLAVRDGAGDVHDEGHESGIEMPPTSTRELEGNPGYLPVSSDEAELGDVIWQPGHMGIYSGDDEDASPRGWQMGTHGAAELTWGPDGDFTGGDDTRHNRPLQTADFEDEIGDQLDEVLPATSAPGETATAPDPAVAAPSSSSSCHGGSLCAGAAR